MIVDPDFLDHWRTGMVVDALGDPMAPIYILRLWSHCQERKADTFVMPTRGLKSQCKFPGDAEAFEAALIEAGFVERNGDAIYVCGWSEKNASLLAAWDNGKKGGRPPKEPRQNPRVTGSKPTDNPAVTQQKPSGNPDLTHAKPIREDKRREEESHSVPIGTDAAGAASGMTDAERRKADAWQGIKSLLNEHGMPKAQTGAFVGKLAKDFGEDIALTAMEAAIVKRPGEPDAWLKATCQGLAGQRAPPEPAWRAEQRTRTQQAAPGVAARGVPADKFFIDVEASNVTPLRLG